MFRVLALSAVALATVEASKHDHRVDLKLTVSDKSIFVETNEKANTAIKSALVTQLNNMASIHGMTTSMISLWKDSHAAPTPAAPTPAEPTKAPTPTPPVEDDTNKTDSPTVSPTPAPTPTPTQKDVDNGNKTDATPAPTTPAPTTPAPTTPAPATAAPTTPAPTTPAPTTPAPTTPAPEDNATVDDTNETNDNETRRLADEEVTIPVFFHGLAKDVKMDAVEKAMTDTANTASLMAELNTALKAAGYSTDLVTAVDVTMPSDASAAWIPGASLLSFVGAGLALISL